MIFLSGITDKFVNVLESLRQLELRVGSLLRFRLRGRVPLDENIEGRLVRSSFLGEKIKLAEFRNPLLGHDNFRLGYSLRSTVVMVDDFIVVGLSPLGSDGEEDGPGEDPVREECTWLLDLIWEVGHEDGITYDIRYDSLGSELLIFEDCRSGSLSFIDLQCQLLISEDALKIREGAELEDRQYDLD